MSDTPKPEEGNVEKEVPKKGWLSRWRSKGDSASETPEPEPVSETPEARRGRSQTRRLAVAAALRPRKIDQARHREHHRPLHQEEARPADARRAGGRADPGRPRRQRRRAPGREARQGAFRQGSDGRGGACGLRRRHRRDPAAGGDLACHRSGEEAARRAGDRRQRQRQDHDHRQARQPLQGRGPQGHAGRRRHLPRRCRRAAQGMGRSRGRAGRSPRIPAPMPRASPTRRWSAPRPKAATCC